MDANEPTGNAPQPQDNTRPQPVASTQNPGINTTTKVMGWLGIAMAVWGIVRSIIGMKNAGTAASQVESQIKQKAEQPQSNIKI